MVKFEFKNGFPHSFYYAIILKDIIELIYNE